MFYFAFFDEILTLINCFYPSRCFEIFILTFIPDILIKIISLAFLCFLETSFACEYFNFRFIFL